MLSHRRDDSRRNIVLLSVVQALGGSNQSIVMTVGALTAVAMAPDAKLVTIPITAMIVGLALATWPSTVVIHRLGRRRGFMLGAGIAVPAAIVASLAVMIGSFYLFTAALFFVGASAASLQQIRFAAADSVAADFKSRAISWVMFGGVAAGFLGPQLSAMSRTWFGGDYAASYLVIAVLALLTIAALSQTRLAPTAPPHMTTRTRQPIRALVTTPALLVPMLTAALSYALMTLIMVAAPLAMVHVCGHSPEAASGAIQWHVIAMFAPSFVTGSIIKRFGAPLTTAAGFVAIIAAAASALAGVGIEHFVVGMALLGLGWNLSFIGSTSLLTEGYRPEDAERVQAVNEQIVFGTMALASIGSGVLLQLIGWQAINMLAIPVALIAIVLLALVARLASQAQTADGRYSGV